MTNTRVALALGRMVTGCLSTMASSLLIYKILSRYRAQRSASNANAAHTKVSTYHRIMLGLSVMDVLFSMGSAAAPFAVHGQDRPSIFGSYGTTATCTAQGASSHLFAAILLYTAALNTYFMLKIRYNVPDVVMSRRYEPWLHGIPIVHAIISTTVGISLTLFNPLPEVDMGCWLAIYPQGCDSSRPDTCIRGHRLIKPSSYSWYAWSLSFVWLFVAFGIVVVNSILIYTAIRQQEQRNQRYSVFATTTTSQNAAAGNAQPPKKCRGSRPVATTLVSQDEAGVVDHESRDHTCSNSTERTESNPPEELADGSSASVTTTDLKATQPIVVHHNDAATAMAASTHIGQTNPDNLDTSILSSTATTAAALPAPSHGPSNIANNVSESTRRRSTVVVATTTKTKKASQVAAWQSTLYCAAVLVPTIVICLPWFGAFMGASDGAQMVFTFLIQYLLATQGIFNLLIYIRPAYKRLRESANNDWSRLYCLSISLFSSDPQHW